MQAWTRHWPQNQHHIRRCLSPTTAPRVRLPRAKLAFEPQFRYSRAMARDQRSLQPSPSMAVDDLMQTLASLPSRARVVDLSTIHWWITWVTTTVPRPNQMMKYWIGIFLLHFLHIISTTWFGNYGKSSLANSHVDIGTKARARTREMKNARSTATRVARTLTCDNLGSTNNLWRNRCGQ